MTGSMDGCPRTITITVRNQTQTETIETRTRISSNVSIRVERIVKKYMVELYDSPTLLDSYPDRPPEFITFDITSTTTLSHIFHILCNQHHLLQELSQDLASRIFDKATTLVDLDSNPVTIDVLLTITFHWGPSLNTWSSFFVLRKVRKLVRDGVIREKSGLEMESCSICLENLLRVSEKVPTRMSCSHVFHDYCITRWLVRKNYSPSCRQVLFEHEEDEEDEEDEDDDEDEDEDEDDDEEEEEE